MQDNTSTHNNSMVFSDNCTDSALDNIKFSLAFVAEAAGQAAGNLTEDATKGLASVIDVLRSALEATTSKVRENEKELHKEIKRLGDEGVKITC